MCFTEVGEISILPNCPPKTVYDKAKNVTLEKSEVESDVESRQEAHNKMTNSSIK